MTAPKLAVGRLASARGQRGMWRITRLADGLAWLVSVTQYGRMRLNGIPAEQLTPHDGLLS